MAKPDERTPRLVALCMLGSLLFNYPILSLFNLPTAVLGIPVIYLFIFIAWILLIVLMGLVVDRD